MLWSIWFHHSCYQPFMQIKHNWNRNLALRERGWGWAGGGVNMFLKFICINDHILWLFHVPGFSSGDLLSLLMNKIITQTKTGWDPFWLPCNYSLVSSLYQCFCACATWWPLWIHLKWNTIPHQTEHTGTLCWPMGRRWHWLPWQRTICKWALRHLLTVNPI